MKQVSIENEFWLCFHKKADTALSDLVYNKLRANVIVNYYDIIHMITTKSK